MLSQDQAAEAWGQISDFITNRTGEIFQEQTWGTRRLAYPIHRGTHHFLEGNYRLTRFSTETPFNQALETFLRLDERVLRSLVVSIPEPAILPDPVSATPAAAPARAPVADAPLAPAEASEETAEAAAETPESASSATDTPVAEAAEPEAEAPAAEAAAEPVAEAE
jgi:small subunit ribosomal protein S6